MLTLDFSFSLYICRTGPCIRIRMLKRLLWLLGKAMTLGWGWIPPLLPVNCDYRVVADSASDSAELQVPRPPKISVVGTPRAWALGKQQPGTPSIAPG